MQQNMGADNDVPLDHGLGDDLNKRGDGTPFWMEDIEHSGKVPYGGYANSGYKVFRNVKDYGAAGDGKTDDTEAINNAIADGGRCGKNCGSSTVKPAIVYFPYGTYLVSSPITAYYNTQMVGNANRRPVIKAAPSFVGLGVISSDEYTGGDGGQEEWFINQNNFLRQLRNFIIDVMDADMTDVAGLHWQVAQATSIQRVAFFQSRSKDKKQIGIFAENGSGGFMSDLVFSGGDVGIRCGNQQFTTRNMAFDGTSVAIDMLWDWGWTWKSLLISDAKIGIRMSGTYRGGSIMVLDSSLSNVDAGILVTTQSGSTPSERFSMVLDHVVLDNVSQAVMHISAGTYLTGGSKTIDSWALGKIYDKSNTDGAPLQGDFLPNKRPKIESLMRGEAYFEREKPQYSSLDAGAFINANKLAAGDGVTDDTFALSLAFAVAVKQNRPLYIPMGTYIATSTIKIPLGTRVIGECWSQIVAQGPTFGDINQPHVLAQVGSPGDKGVLEMQDLLFTVEGPTAGAILMEWNVAQDSQGSAAMWDTHFRVGGAAGSGLQAAQCPKLTGEVNKNCIAATALLHMAASSSGYLENIWAWVSDHDLDSGLSQTQIDVYVGRGILLESRAGPTWLYGTSSEHAVLYQYMLSGAKDVFMGMIQTESPYYLPSPQAPAPFTDQVGYFTGDPSFNDCPHSDPHCAASWGLIVNGATNIHIFGAGLYNWFQAYIQPCVDAQDCQSRVVKVTSSGNVWLYNLYTIGTVEMVNFADETPVLAKDNTNTNEHPFTSVVNAWLLASSGTGSGIQDDEEDDYYSKWFHPEKRPNCDSQLHTLDDFSLAINSIPPFCYDKYISNIHFEMLTQALKDYDKIVSEGYDKKFETYERIVKDQAPQQVDNFMEGAEGSGNWDCTQKKYREYCDNCQNIYQCSNKCCEPETEPGCKDGLQPFDVDCPDDIPVSWQIPLSAPEITYTMTDKAAIFKDLDEKFGIPEAWITFGDRKAAFNYGCFPSGDPDDLDSCTVYWHNYPLLTNISIPNPKKIVRETYDNCRNLVERGNIQLKFSLYGLTSQSHLVDALALPALSMVEGIDSMRKVVEVAEKAEEQERKELIAGFIGGILFFVPVAGEVAGAVGGGLLRTIIGMAGDLANVGLSIYDLVSDPESAITICLEFLTGGRSSKKPFKEAAEAIRKMPDPEFKKMSPRMKVHMEDMQRPRRRCGRK